MTQDAVVTKQLSGGMAEVAVSRGTACGSNCGNCEACVFQNEIKTVAKNTVNASPGDKVIIESVSSRIFGAELTLYFIPLVLLFVGYAIGAALGLGEGGCILIAAAAFALAVAVVVAFHRVNKKKKPITFEIIQLR